MKFVCHQNWTQLPNGANALFAEAEKHSIFFSRLWFETLASAALEREQTLLLACVQDGDKVLAILPLKQIGESLYALTSSYYSSLYTILLVENAPPTILECLAQGLLQSPFQSLCLEPIAEDDPVMQQLQNSMAAYGATSHRYFCFYNWVHPLLGQSFAEYMAKRPAKVCHTIARKQRKLAREREYEIQLFQQDNLQQGLADYHAIYQASWKAQQALVDFINQLVVVLSASGYLRFAVLYIEEQPAAAQIWFVVHRKASIFRLAYDEAWKTYSPGSILTQYLMQHVIDIDQVTEIDFLTGNESYKQDWMTERRERWGLRWSLAHKPQSHFSSWLAKVQKLWA